ncbi:MAG: molybdopterin-dependent oxidoreductase [Planctomycetes bacterium]|nr:molybdopterin-dependent oxidoreductase [Planctomycetota bacterium]
MTGKVANELELSLDDLRALPAEYRIADASRFVAGIQGEAVRLAGVLARAGAKAHPLFVNAGTRDGAVRLALFRHQVEPLALVVFARDGRALSAADGGPFRLVVPGFHDGAGDLRDLGWIEVATSPGPDNRGVLPHRASVLIGQQRFDRERTWADPRHADTFVVPQPNS